MITKNVKIKFLALAIVVLCGCFVPIAYANTTEIGKPDDATWIVDEGENHVWYKLSETTLTVGGSGKMPDWNNAADNDKKYTKAPWFEKGITDVVIEEGVSRIGNYSFFRDGSLSSLKLANSVKEIGDQTFGNCPNLKTIEFGDNIESIGLGAFKGAAFTSLDFPEGLKTIAAGAFQDNKSLAKVILPSTLTEIGQWGFNNTTALKEIISYSAIAPTLGVDVFRNVLIEKITIPSGSLDSYKTTWNIDDTQIVVSYVHKLTATSNGITSIIVISDTEDQSNKAIECITEQDDACSILNIGEWTKYYISIEPDSATSNKITSIKINGEPKDITFPTGKNTYEVTTADAFNLEIEGVEDYHYSDTENPNTIDGIVPSLIVGTVSLISLICCNLYANRKQSEEI